MTPARPTGGGPRPRVRLAGGGVPTPLLVGLGLVVALGLFLYLDTARRARELASTHPVTAQGPALAAPPPLFVPPPPAAAVSLAAPRPVRLAPGYALPLATRTADIMPLRPMRIHSQPPSLPDEGLPPPRQIAGQPGGAAAALVVDLTSGPSVTGAGPAADGAGAVEDVVHATLIRNRAAVIPQGTVIAAVLETPLNSDRPGLARGIVAKDVLSFDGSRVLIPRGSRLIGEFKAEANPSLRRVLITWDRLIRPDGVAIRIASPVADAMGGAGVPGSVNTHFMERFSAAVLQSALAVGVNLASTLSSNSNSAIYVGLPSQGGQIGQQLLPSTTRVPTVKVREGTEISVMVARDLDFSGMPAVR